MSQARTQAVILAGGLGTRMLPSTERTPKFLLPVKGRPFAAWLLERLAACGYDEALVCIAHLGDEVRRVVGDGSQHGISVRYADEGERLLGTAGALRKAISLLEPTFLVTYGDSYLPFDYKAPLEDLRAHPEALGTMAVFNNEGRFDRSNAAVSGEWVTRYEKQSDDATVDPDFDHIDYGATALRREVLEQVPEGVTLGLDALQNMLAREHRLRAFNAKERFYEIGSRSGLAALEVALGRGEAR